MKFDGPKEQQIYTLWESKGTNPKTPELISLIDHRFSLISIAGEMPNIYRKVRLRCAESANPVSCAASVLLRPSINATTAQQSKVTELIYLSKNSTPAPSTDSV